MNEKLKTLFDTNKQKHTEAQANYNFSIKPLEDKPGAWQVILTLDGKTQNCVFMIDSNNEPPVDEVIKFVEIEVKKLILYYVKKNLL